VVTLLPLVSACSQSSATARPPTETISPVTHHRPKEPTPHVVDGRLASPFTYDAGSLRLDPPPTSYHAAISAQNAYKRFESGPGSAFVSSTTPAPEVFLALYSTIGYGPGIGTSNPNAIGWNKVPVWVIRFTHFPSYPSGAGDSAGSSADVGQSLAHDDLVGVLRSNDGRMLGLYQDVPDDPATWREHR
jgi:hypothetical protein